MALSKFLGRSLGSLAAGVANTAGAGTVLATAPGAGEGILTIAGTDACLRFVLSSPIGTLFARSRNLIEATFSPSYLRTKHIC